MLMAILFLLLFFGWQSTNTQTDTNAQENLVYIIARVDAGTYYPVDSVRRSFVISAIFPLVCLFANVNG